MKELVEKILQDEKARETSSLEQAIIKDSNEFFPWN